MESLERTSCRRWSSPIHSLVAVAALLFPVLLPAQGVPAKWKLVPDLRIDAETAGLSQITYLSVSQSGLIAVEQPQDRRVVFFNSKGQKIGTFGRAGEGPGDFRGNSDLGWIGDTLWVRDATLYRMTFVRPDLKLLRTVGFAPPGPPETSLACRINHDVRSPEAPFCARPIRAATPDSSLRVTVVQDNPTSPTGRFLISAIRRGKGTVYSRDVRTTGVPIASDFLDKVLERVPAGQRESVREVIPHFFEPVHQMLLTADGFAWLRMAAEHGAKDTDYWVLAPDGALVAKITLPTSTMLHAVSRSAVWVVETSESGLENVVRYRVQTTAEIKSSGMNGND